MSFIHCSIHTTSILLRARPLTTRALKLIVSMTGSREISTVKFTKTKLTKTLLIPLKTEFIHSFHFYASFLRDRRLMTNFSPVTIATQFEFELKIIFRMRLFLSSRTSLELSCKKCSESRMVTAMINWRYKLTMTMNK